MPNATQSRPNKNRGADGGNNLGQREGGKDSELPIRLNFCLHWHVNRISIAAMSIGRIKGRERQRERERERGRAVT